MKIKIISIAAIFLAAASLHAEWAVAGKKNSCVDGSGEIQTENISKNVKALRFRVEKSTTTITEIKVHLRDGTTIDCSDVVVAKGGTSAPIATLTEAQYRQVKKVSFKYATVRAEFDASETKRKKSNRTTTSSDGTKRSQAEKADVYLEYES